MTGDRIAYRYACRHERGAPVALVISHIRHIADLLARHEFQYFLLQFA